MFEHINLHYIKLSGLFIKDHYPHCLLHYLLHIIFLIFLKQFCLLYYTVYTVYCTIHYTLHKSLKSNWQILHWTWFSFLFLVYWLWTLYFIMYYTKKSKRWVYYLKTTPNRPSRQCIVYIIVNCTLQNKLYCFIKFTLYLHTLMFVSSLVYSAVHSKEK